MMIYNNVDVEIRDNKIAIYDGISGEPQMVFIIKGEKLL